MENIFRTIIFNDGTSLSTPFDAPDRGFNDGIKDRMREVEQYWLTDQNGAIFHGVDVVHRNFILNGTIVHTDLPEGDYQLIAYRQVRQSTGGTGSVSYCFGLHGNVDGRNHKRVVFLHPDGTMTIAT